MSTKVVPSYEDAKVAFTWFIAVKILTKEAWDSWTDVQKIEAVEWAHRKDRNTWSRDAEYTKQELETPEWVLALEWAPPIDWFFEEARKL